MQGLPGKATAMGECELCGGAPFHRFTCPEFALGLWIMAAVILTVIVIAMALGEGRAVGYAFIVGAELVVLVLLGIHYRLRRR
jgi:hypothetical protein